MANPTGSTAVAGDIAKGGIYEAVQRGVKDTITLNKGDLVSFDSNGYATEASTTSSIAVGFGVCMKDADNGTSVTGHADGFVKATIAVGNSWVYVTAGGAIKPLALVKVSSATKVVAHTKPSDLTSTPTSTQANTIRDYFGLTFGRYFGHELEEAEMTDAADTDVIIVRLGL